MYENIKTAVVQCLVHCSTNMSKPGPNSKRLKKKKKKERDPWAVIAVQLHNYKIIYNNQVQELMYTSNSIS